MKYVVFVTKHHDGFTMWPTKQKRFPEGAEFPVHYSIADTPYQKDPVRMVQQAAKKHAMKLGWYYSTRDWTHPDYLQGDNKTYNDYYENQVDGTPGKIRPGGPAVVRPHLRPLGPLHHPALVRENVFPQPEAAGQRPRGPRSQ